jgi:hypothetical protein
MSVTGTHEPRLLQYEMAMILVMHLWDAPIAVVHFNKEGINKGIE